MSSNTTKLKVGILIISDTASADNSADKAGPVLKETFSTTGREQWDVVETKIIPDDVLEIQRFIQRWTDGEDALNCIVTSGGTGFAVKDNTPEVCVHYLALEVCCFVDQDVGSCAIDSPACSWTCVRTYYLKLSAVALLMNYRHGMLASSLAVTPCTSHDIGHSFTFTLICESCDDGSSCGGCKK
jgi:hypothetical protein